MSKTKTTAGAVPALSAEYRLDDPQQPFTGVWVYGGLVPRRQRSAGIGRDVPQADPLHGLQVRQAVHPEPARVLGHAVLGGDLPAAEGNLGAFLQTAAILRRLDGEGKAEPCGCV